MVHTRRELLRRTAAVSLGGVAQASPLAMFGQAPCTSFLPGVRIFFSGAWVFCADPQDKTRMLAIARDLPHVPHIVPFGAWQSGWDDRAQPRLVGNDVAHPYQVGVTGVDKPSPSMNQLFADTAKKQPFVYLLNANQDLQILPGAINVFVLSVPIPTQMILAAFFDGASVSGPSEVLAPFTSSTVGVATTHVFDYQGAGATLSFMPPSGSGATMPIQLSSGQSFASDMHFHTVTRTKDRMNHAKEMFTNLLNIVSSKSGSVGSGNFALAIPYAPTLSQGPFIPSCITTQELEMSLGVAVARTDLASCAGGSFGLGS